VCRLEGLLNQIGRARSAPGLFTQLRAIGIFHGRCSTTPSVDASYNSLEGGCDQGLCCTLCPALTGLPHRSLTTGYNKSLNGMCAVVGCRYGKPGDQLHSATSAARKCRAPGCTYSMTHRCAVCALRKKKCAFRLRAAHTAPAPPCRHTGFQYRIFLFTVLYNNQAPRYPYNWLPLALRRIWESGIGSAQKQQAHVPSLLAWCAWLRY
jgi:hypothetical protein